MTSAPDTIVIDILREIQERIAHLEAAVGEGRTETQAELAALRVELGNLAADVGLVKESTRRIDGRLGALDSLVTGVHRSINWQNDEIDALRGRTESLEDTLRPGRG